MWGMSPNIECVLQDCPLYAVGRKRFTADDPIRSVRQLLSSLLGRHQNRRSGQPCHRVLHSTDRRRIGTLLSALEHLVLLLWCALFFRFLSSISLTTPPAR